MDASHLAVLRTYVRVLHILIGPDAQGPERPYQLGFRDPSHSDQFFITRRYVTITFWYPQLQKLTKLLCVQICVGHGLENVGSSEILTESHCQCDGAVLNVHTCRL